MKFKFQELASQFHSPKIDPRVKIIAIVLDDYCQREFGKEVLVTEIFRTLEQQIRLYNLPEDYPIEKLLKMSPHLHGRAIDFRSNFSRDVPYWKEDQLRAMELYINKLFPYYNKTYFTLRWHRRHWIDENGKNRYGADHLHLQVDWRWPQLSEWGFLRKQ